MPAHRLYPSLYQINTRVWLRRLSACAGHRVGLVEVSDEEIDALAEMGFDWIWLLSVWATGEAGRAVSRSNPGWREAFRRVLPDLTEDDICGSGFAVADYSVSPALGGPAALADFRQRLAARGMRLMLDFVPNHTAPDHRWVQQRPDFYVGGTQADLSRAPGNYVRITTPRGEKILALGRDPYFPGWPDTLQLNYGNPRLQESIREELGKIADQCDGLRCDMAMLLVPEVFARTWGVQMNPFWPDAIAQIRAAYPEFMFMAEVYWDMEWALEQQGFDYCYDKRLYDRLRGFDARGVREHLAADLDYQGKLARFVENHDEPRAAESFPEKVREAAAVATYFSPGLRFFHQGQLSGARIHVPAHLCRGPEEAEDTGVAAFYKRLLPALRLEAFRSGQWERLDPEPAWAGNPTFDNFIACSWQGSDGRMLLVVVNFAGTQGQCRLRLPFAGLAGHSIRLRDPLGEETYERQGAELLVSGLYVDHAPWHYNVFDVGVSRPKFSPVPA